MDHRFHYLRDRNGQPVGCVAIRVVNKAHGEVLIRYQLSVLNPLDRFDRNLARSIAKARLDKSPHTAVLIGHANMHAITRTVMYAIGADKKLPSRAVKAANYWLKNQERLPGLNHGIFA